jgi:hypothetical protein
MFRKNCKYVTGHVNTDADDLRLSQSGCDRVVGLLLSSKTVMIIMPIAHAQRRKSLKDLK